jgi:DNA-binding transcriptional LysR family regulator
MQAVRIQSMDSLMRTIIAVADAGSISKAAHELHLSQPAISQRLHLAEQELDIPLFDRSRTPIKPTYAGEIYLVNARRIVALENDLFDNIDKIANRTKRRLRVGISAQRARRFLPDIVDEFSKTDPECVIQLEEHPCLKLETLLDENLVDIAIGPPKMDTTFYTNDLLIEENILLAVPANLRSKLSNFVISTNSQWPLLSLSALKVIPLIVAPKKMHFGKVLWNMLDAANVVPDISMECNSIEMALFMTERGLGATLCSTVFAEEHSSDIDYYLIKGYEKAQQYVASYRNDWTLTDDALIFLKILKKQLRQIQLLPNLKE